MILKQMARSDPGEWLPSLLEQGENREPLEFLNVSEFKTRGNGQMELKFTDRLAILEKLMELAQSDNALKEFYQELMASPDGKNQNE